MMFAVNKVHPAFDVSMVSDASGSCGYGAINGCSWFQLGWAGLRELSRQNITIKELLPIVVAAVQDGQERQSGPSVITQQW